REALRRGDSEAQEALRKTGTDLQVLSIELQPHEDERADALDKVRLWELDGTDGWSKLDRLVDVLEAEVVREADGLSIELQIAGIQAGTFRPRRFITWAVAVRDIVFVNLVRRIPLRGENASGIRIAPLLKQYRRNGRTYTRMLQPNWATTDREGSLWRGGVELSFDAEEVKQPRGFKASFITPREVGQSDAERAIRRAALELYLMPGGAREMLLRLRNGSIAWSPYLFPVAASINTTDPEKRAARHYRWSRATASTRFTELLERHGRKIGLDFRRLREVFGAGSLHVVRHLFGSHFVAVGLIKLASLLLGHANTQITEEIYTGISTISISVDEMERRWADAVEAGQRRTVPTASDHGSGAVGDFASETLQLLAAHKDGLIDQRVLTEALEALRRRHGMNDVASGEPHASATALRIA
ncbi:MAG TPA: hypothetical protein VFS08_05305, partial [Gemmatimonadaceae bacterium]|nr:hypothetical protein [Gemmatimonadaceae bacterium]